MTNVIADDARQPGRRVASESGQKRHRRNERGQLEETPRKEDGGGEGGAQSGSRQTRTIRVVEGVVEEEAGDGRRRQGRERGEQRQAERQIEPIRTRHNVQLQRRLGQLRA